LCYIIFDANGWIFDSNYKQKRGKIRDCGILLESDVRRRTRKKRRRDDDDDGDEGTKKRKVASDNFLPDNFKIKF